jgi:hypothetical protein
MSKNRCPVCHGWVGRCKNGTLFPHKRYVNGGGWRPGLDHMLVPCEGGAGPSAFASLDQARDT